MTPSNPKRFQVTHSVREADLPRLIALLGEHGFDPPTVSPATDDLPKEGSMTIAAPIKTAEWEFLHNREGETYEWPELTERYRRFDVYRGSNDQGTIDFAIGECERYKTWGRDRKYYIVFHVTAGFKRPLVEFLEADDYEQSRELIAVIRGSDGGRKLYNPSDTLPAAYDDFEVVTYRDRIDVKGSWNKLAVVAHEDDHATMLGHALFQAESRFGIAPY